MHTAKTSWINLLPAFSLILMLSTSCQQGIKGKGEMVTENRDLPAFTSINSDAAAEIVLIQDDHQMVSVKGHADLLPLLHTSVSGGELKLEMKDHVHLIGSPRIEVTVHVPALQKINLAGIGTIKTLGDFRFQKIEMTISGVGSIEIGGSAEEVHYANSGAGAFQCKNLSADSVYAVNSGVGSIQCYASKYLKAVVSGVGSISYAGNPVVDKTVSGVGSVSKE